MMRTQKHTDGSSFLHPGTIQNIRSTQIWEKKHWVNNREPGTRIPELRLLFCSADYSGGTKTMMFKMAAD